MADFSIRWVDKGREPQCQPDPRYPAGKDADLSEGAAKTCKSELPYPAKRCGVYVVRCRKCGVNAGITTAGRPDDPRSVTFPCYVQRHGVHVLP